MSRYRLSFEIETDTDSSELLDRLIEFAEEIAEETDSEFDGGIATVEDLDG